MGICPKCNEEKRKRKNMETNPFPKGERIFRAIADYNISIKKKEQKLCERVELFFSLTNIINQNVEHSLKISIIHNKKIGLKTPLGTLKGFKGEKIDFGEHLIVDYFFEREQIMIIELLLNGEETGKENKFALCNLMKNKENKKTIIIEQVGSLEINYKKLEEQDNNLGSEISCFQFYIILDNSIFLEKDNYLKDIFYIINNVKDGKNRRPIYKSHEFDFELNKQKKTPQIGLESDLLCNSKDMEIFFELYSPSINSNSPIGYSTFNLNNLISNLNHDKIVKKDIKSLDHGKLGNLTIFYNQKNKMCFESFIKKGQINLEIAIDYTESNGLPKDKNSLHYIDGENDYEKAIKSCGDILAYYDSDQLFPVYGFGGIPEGKKEVSHCFNINLNDNDPNVKGVDNIIAFYKESLKKVKLLGPTLFSPVISKVINKINEDLKNKPEENNYYILMILTDGIISDMDDTIDKIVEGSKLPLSIVIIGIGNADFSNMEELDGDEIPLINSNGEIRKRDIVQFVQFNQFKNNVGTDLAEEVLREIPRQIEDYYLFCGTFYE